MDESAKIQLAIEVILAVGCVIGYRVESARVASPSPGRAIEALRIVGEGEWVLLGASEEASFESVTATPELVAEGFELEGSRGRVAVPKGAKLRIVNLDGARRAPIDAITRDGSVRPRFTFELKPGTPVFADVMLPVLHAYRGEPPSSDVPVVLGGSAEAVNSAASVAFPGCWIMILVAGVLSSLVASLASWTTLGWIGIGGTTALMLLGWTAMPAAGSSRPA